MPTLDVNELNIVISVLGAFTVLYELISVKMKQKWYLGEALPAMLIGILLGTVAGRLIGSERWGSAVKDQTENITLGLTRVVIGIQLVMAGYKLPAKYPWIRWRDMALLLISVMTIMWLCTTGCIKLMVPKLTTLTTMVIGSLGRFADKYVPRALREILSAEACFNDGFGFPFLLLATYLIRHAPVEDINFKPNVQRLADVSSEGAHRLMSRADDVGRLGGGAGQAVEIWIVEGWLYFILWAAIVGAVMGIVSMYAVNFSLKSESFLLFPTALGLFVIGVTGCAGLDDLLACFCAGSALNWKSNYLEETLKRHDEVNGSIDILLNFGGFMYIGAIMPWDEFHQPDTTGITYGRLIAPGSFGSASPAYTCDDGHVQADAQHREELERGALHGLLWAHWYWSRILRRTCTSFVSEGRGRRAHEEEGLLRAMGPIVYFLVLFSIVVHGLSVPGLELIYRWQNVQPIVEMEPVTTHRLSVSVPLPNNAHVDPRNGSVVHHNRFSRAVSVGDGGGLNIGDLENRYGSGRSEQLSAPDRSSPEAPTWRLTAATDGSADTVETLKANDGGTQQQKEEEEVILGNTRRVTYLNGGNRF